LFFRPLGQEFFAYISKFAIFSVVIVATSFRYLTAILKAYQKCKKGLIKCVFSGTDLIPFCLKTHHIELLL